MAAVTTTSSASNLQMDYMKLLVTQLQNQNPLEPMDNKDMSAQLAQFSQLQQPENLNTSFRQVLELTQRSYASSLIGKEISFQVQADDGTTEIKKAGKSLKEKRAAKNAKQDAQKTARESRDRTSGK